MKQDVNDTCAAVAALFFPNSPENLLSSTNLTALLSSQYSSGCRQQGRFKGKKWVMGTHSSIFRNGGAIFICLVKQWENFAEKLYAGHWHCQQYTYLQKLKTENWSNKNACVWFWILMCSTWNLLRSIPIKNLKKIEMKIPEICLCLFFQAHFTNFSQASLLIFLAVMGTWTKKETCGWDDTRRQSDNACMVSGIWPKTCCSCIHMLLSGTRSER